MKKLAIVSAMEIEISYVHEYLKQRNGWKKINDEAYANKDKELIVTAHVMGVGKVNAAYKTAEILLGLEPDLIVNVGYAGAMVEDAKRGDLAIGNDYVQVDFKPFLDENRPVIRRSPEAVIRRLEAVAERLGFTWFTGTIATGDFFLQSTEKKNEIRREYNPIAFDMESAAVAQAAAKRNVDFVALRTFSDLADDNALRTALDTSGQIEHKPIVLLIEALEH